MAEPIRQGQAPCVLRLEDVIREFGTTIITRVLHGVSLCLLQGEFAALVGPSGSGKSTLLHLMGLLDRPTSGKIFLQDKDTSLLSDEELTRLRGSSLGFIFQFHYLLPAFSALENVMIPALANAGEDADTIRARAKNLLERVGLAEKIKVRATDLSGGQQQRVAIARALIMDPILVLADEPTGNLDTQTADGVFDLLQQANKERGTTFLLVTHDSRLAERCDRLIQIVDGQIHQNDPSRIM
jgi:lipoprotein-releasing system ATP-binding protein